MRTILFWYLATICSVAAQEIRFKNVFDDSTYSFRGISIPDKHAAWVSGNGIGRSVDAGKKWTVKKVKGYESLDFRTIYAFDSITAVIANTGSPAYVLRTSNGGSSWDIVYKNEDTHAFIDGIDFWNEAEGIIYGDPIGGRLMLLKTNNGGKTWEEVSVWNCPALSDGEASFAASGTGIRCYDNGVVIIATGGKVSRLLISGNRGESWSSVETPILQGEASTGIFSFAIKNNTGIIVGGDYLSDTLKKDHVFYTMDMGKNWISPDNPTGGYRECVEFISDQVAVAVGPGGADVTFNAGKDWRSIDDGKQFHVIRKARRGNLVIAAGKGRIARLTVKNQE